MRMMPKKRTPRKKKSTSNKVNCRDELEGVDELGAIADNAESVRLRIARACERSHRETDLVTLIAVTKNFPSDAVRVAFVSGIRDFGENRVQEAASKYGELGDIRSSLRLHFIGHLQTNKVREALEISDVIHSIDSLKLAEAVDRHAAEIVQCLLEVNVAGEQSKHGFRVEDLDGAAKAIKALHNIEIAGLMTIAPLVDNPEDVRPVFVQLRELNHRYGFRQLSMGMTDDFEIAIEEGSTMVRIGRAIFGERR